MITKDAVNNALAQLWVNGSDKDFRELIDGLLKERDAYREVAIKIDHDWTMRDGYDWPNHAIDVDAEAKRILEGKD